MKITSFYPMIMTSDFEGVKATYEALGFKVAQMHGMKERTSIQLSL